MGANIEIQRWEGKPSILKCFTLLKINEFVVHIYIYVFSQVIVTEQSYFCLFYLFLNLEITKEQMGVYDTCKPSRL